MTTQIRRADYPDYQSYIDAIAEPVGGATNPAVWDEVEQAQGPTAVHPGGGLFIPAQSRTESTARPFRVEVLPQDTVNAAAALTVFPANTQVTVCVPVPGLVVEDVL